MSLNTLNDFFSNESDWDRDIFLYEGKTYTKGDVTRLIKKAMSTVQKSTEKEYILHTRDNFRFVIGFFALMHCGKDIILASNVRDNTLEAIGTLNVFPEIDLEPSVGEACILPFEPEKANVFFFTSGSTSQPKRIKKTFRGLYLELASVDALLAPTVRKKTVTLATVNMSHLYGMTFSLLYSLARNFLIDAVLIETPEELAHKLSQHENVFLVTSPAFMERLGRYKDIYSFPSKPYLMTSSGAPLSREGAEAARDLFGISPLEIFGSTETGVVANRRQLESEIWTLFPYAKAHVGPDGRLVVTSNYIDRDEFVMGDAVEFVDDTHFFLKGRTDRMVKIEEKRVSLPELEAVLNAQELIHKAYCLPVTNRHGRATVGACVCLSDIGRKFVFSEGRRKTVELLRNYMAGQVDKVAIPVKWRFVDEIPVNEQSKFMNADIYSLMRSDIAEPVVLKKVFTKDALDMDLAFLPESTYFEGHFPEQAILPGVVQIHFAMYFAHRHWKTGQKIREIKKLKFSKTIRPSQKLRLSLIRFNAEVSFKYHDSDTIYSSGTIVYV